MSAGQTFRNIHRRLGAGQKELARALGCTPQNISLYDRGQALSPERAKRLIDFARSRGLQIGYEHVFDGAELPEMPRPEVAP